MPSDDSQTRSLIARLGAEQSWANTVDRQARTQPARAGLDAKFLREADGDPVRAAHLRKAHFTRLTLASVISRRRSAAARANQPTLDAAAEAAVAAEAAFLAGGAA